MCIEMEGAFIVHVCFLCNVSYLILHSIYNIPNNDNLITYNNLLREDSLINTLEQYLQMSY